MRRKMWVFVFAVFWALTSRAQVTTGTISGTVTDSTGAVMPGVRMVIQNEDTGISRTVMTDAAGRYAAPSLSRGNYRVTATMEGFQTEVRSGIVLTVGREAVVDMRLQVGAVTQTVEVTGEAPLVQTTESTVSYLVDDRTLRDLPLNGRDMSELLLLIPGVTQSPNPGGQSYNGYGKRIGIAGMRGEDNVYLLDGGLIGDFRRHVPAGPSGALLGLETVQEFQVLTNSLNAQYGRALGGAFNAVSKSGTNEWHGDAYDYLRNSALDARNFFDHKDFESDPRLPPFRRNQFGATVGGPIKKDKTFFFVAYEGTRESLGITEISIVPDANARLGILPTGGNVTVAEKMKPYVNQYPLPSPNGRNFGDGTAELIYPFKQPTTEDFGQARLDFQISSNDSFFSRFTRSNSGQIIDASFPGFEQNASLGSWLLTLSETHVFSPRALNTLAFHFNRVSPLDTGKAPPPAPGITVVPGQPDSPQVSPGSGITTYGGAGFSTSPTILISNRFAYQDDAHLTLGAHSLQFGGLLERLQFNSSKTNRPFGVWSFTNLRNFLLGNVNTFRGAIPGYGDYRRGFRHWFFALYIQDSWRVTPKLTVNLGVRWEPYTTPSEVNGKIANLRHIGDATGTVGGPYWLNKSWKDIGPRVGLAWSPFASGKTSVRAGFGLLYEPNDPNQYYNPMDRQPPLAYDFLIPVPANANFFPDAFTQVRSQSTLGPAYAVPYENNKSPRALQYNFTLQQQIGASNVISVGYTGSRGINLLSVDEIGMPEAVFDGVSLAIPTDAKLVNPNWSAMSLFAPNSNSWYNGFLVSYQRRFAGGFQGQVSYTFSKNLAENEVGQAANAVTVGSGRTKYWYDHHVQKGLSGYDFRNVLSFNYSYELPFGKGLNGVAGKLLSGWQTTGVLNVRNGQPQTVSAGVSSVLSALDVPNRSPNLVLGCGPIVLGGPDKYFDVNCYSAPGTRQLGNLGRNTLIGPGSVTWNPALFKKTPLTERMNLEFRAEFFNMLNRANFASPASSVFTGTGGLVGSAGRITRTTSTSRQIQFALKLVF